MYNFIFFNPTTVAVKLFSCLCLPHPVTLGDVVHLLPLFPTLLSTCTVFIIVGGYLPMEYFLKGGGELLWSHWQWCGAGVKDRRR